MSHKTQFDLMKWKQDEWEHLKDHRDKCIVVGKLEMLKDLTEYLETLRESYTRLLVINGIDEKEYDSLKSRYKGDEGLDGDATGFKVIDTDSKDDYHLVDDEGDKHSFDNC